MMWENRKIRLPCPVLEIGDIADILLDELDAKEIEDLAETLQAFHRPARRGIDPFDSEW